MWPAKVSWNTHNYYYTTSKRSLYSTVLWSLWWNSTNVCSYCTYYYAAGTFVLNIICIGTLNCTSNSMKLIMINCMHETCPNGIEKFLIYVLSRSKQPLHWWSLHACLRMQSTAEINIRVLAEDTALMGYHIPAEVLRLLIVTYSFQLSDYYTHCYIYTDKFCLLELSNCKEWAALSESREIWSGTMGKR